VRHDNQPATRVADAVDVVRIEDSSSADQRLVSEAASEALDRENGSGEFSGISMMAKPRRHERVADRHRASGIQPAQDRDERASAPEIAEREHAGLVEFRAVTAPYVERQRAPATASAAVCRSAQDGQRPHGRASEAIRAEIGDGSRR
jgi:hypothetical protein